MTLQASRYGAKS